MSSYRDLNVWKESMKLAADVYKVTTNFLNSEQFGLTSQVRRAAISMPSNLVEGQKRGYKNDFLHFCRIAYGSAAELEIQFELSLMLGYLKHSDFEILNARLQSIMRMLNRLILSIDPKSFR